MIFRKNEPEWLAEAIIYQIYPQSFQDSNGDGIGDLQGIINRLDYLKSLGVNTLWLNPCFDSPFGDAGYDIRDFYKIAPRYGTEADMINLFEQAHASGLRVVLDLVAGHTSMDHHWFEWEAKNPKHPQANRYIWKNRDFDKEEGPTRDDFISNFFWHQPALNFGWETVEEPWQDSVDAPGPRKNREELRKILAYWFDLGCDGFRVDMAASLVKQNPDFSGKPTGNIALWQEIRAWMDEKYPDRILAAEWSEPSRALKAGFHLDFMIHFNAVGYPSLFFNGTGTLPYRDGPCYFDDPGNGCYVSFRDSYADQLKKTAGKGYISLPTACHDFQRLRCGSRGWAGLWPAWVFLMTQAGVPTIYYGDEIGMRFVEGTAPKEGSTLTGVIAPNAGAPDGERAGTRTPMQWNQTKNDGFSTASPKFLYLPIDDDPKRPTVAQQETQSNSLLNFVKELLHLRKTHPALGADASFEILNPDGVIYPLLYQRRAKSETCLIVINPTASAQSIRIKSSDVELKQLIGNAVEAVPREDGLSFQTSPFGFAIFSVQEAD